VFWHFGGADPAAFEGLDPEVLATRGIPAKLPMNHSPLYAPLQDPTIELGVRALLGAARAWLADGE
jgi:hippurate hydrolase